MLQRKSTESHDSTNNWFEGSRRLSRQGTSNNLRKKEVWVFQKLGAKEDGEAGIKNVSERQESRLDQGLDHAVLRQLSYWAAAVKWQVFSTIPGIYQQDRS